MVAGRGWGDTVYSIVEEIGPMQVPSLTEDRELGWSSHSVPVKQHYISRSMSKERKYDEGSQPRSILIVQVEDSLTTKSQKYGLFHGINSQVVR